MRSRKRGAFAFSAVGAGLALFCACGGDDSSGGANLDFPDALSGGDVGVSGGCRQIALVASKVYSPTQYFDANLTLVAPDTFVLPATIAVLDGNAGNRSNKVEFTYTSGTKSTTCKYFGLAPRPHPILPADRAQGLQYGDPTCTGGVKAGDDFQATSFTLHVDDGDDRDPANETRVGMLLREAEPCGVVDGGGDADAESGAPDASADSSDASDANGTDATSADAADAADSASDSSSTSDASSADAADAATDAAATCGDGIRASAEECDLGSSVPARATCSTTCEVNDLLAEISSGEDAAVANARALGDGRHPIAARSDGGFAISYIQQNLSPIRIALTAVGSNGVPLDNDVVIDADTQGVFGSDPVVAALPSGAYATAFTDLNGDGDSLGIALRSVDFGSGTAGSLLHANTTTSFSQYDVDILWDGSALVVAWTDDSSIAGGPDIKLRTFDGSLNPTSAEQSIAATTDSEDEAALCEWEGSYAIAWRDDDAGVETIRARAGTNVWMVGPLLPGPANERPAIAELDASHLLLIFAQGTDDVGDSKISAAVLDTAVNGSVTPVDLPNLTFATGLSQDQPNIIAAGAHFYAAWRTAAATGDANAEELWLKELAWNGSSLDVSGSEITLPRFTAHRTGDQRRPALAYSSAVGALVLGWDDLGKVFGVPESTSDVVTEFVPLPLVRNP